MKFLRVFFPGESMWVVPTGPNTGVLDNIPVSPLHDAKLGDEVKWKWKVYRGARIRCREFVHVTKRADKGEP